MDIRVQISMVFHLDKCIGCHTCSVACKHLWTDRRGAEYMWWNNVETKPGTGYPARWEDQDRFQGGWQRRGGRLRLRQQGRLSGLLRLFHNPDLPTLEQYYEPWTYRYRDLFDAPPGDDQPTAVPVSLVTGRPMEIRGGPNWDDDLSGSPEHALHDPNLEGLPEEDRAFLVQLERMVHFYVPRICNHCLNPSCVASCPQAAIYKRGEDGIVLVHQQRCRGWRLCVSGCPYKKVYYNWETGRSEKCILCYPRLETGQAPACFHSCVGRIRYLGVLLYDAEAMERVASVPEEDLVAAQRDMILDPSDPTVRTEALRRGIGEDVLAAAQRSPVYRFVKRYGLALPLHPEFRTLPMLFYVPPLLPMLATDSEEATFTGLDRTRVPVRYLTRLFTAGNPEPLERAYRVLEAVRRWRRAVEDGDGEAAARCLEAAGLDAGEMEHLYRLTALAPFEERFVVPPVHREEAMALLEEADQAKGSAGLGFLTPPGGA